MYTNPAKDVVVQATDCLFVLAQQTPYGSLKPFTKALGAQPPRRGSVDSGTKPKKTGAAKVGHRNSVGALPSLLKKMSTQASGAQAAQTKPLATRAQSLPMSADESVGSSTDSSTDSESDSLACSPTLAATASLRVDPSNGEGLSSADSTDVENVLRNAGLFLPGSVKI